MTADEVLEAMARAVFLSIADVDDSGLWDEQSNDTKDFWRSHARAAVRAAHAAGAILVAEMPNDLDIGGGGHGDGYKLRTKMGWNNALAAVRAKAITGEEV